MLFLEPNSDVLRDKCKNASSVLVSAPFYSGKALRWVRPAQGGRMEFWTRLNPYDWVAGVADPQALLRFATNEVGEENFALLVNPRLHAKLYLVDGAWAWVGSANLSVAAFGDQIELLCQTEEADHLQDLASMVERLRKRLRPMALADLATFVAVTEDVVKAARDKEQGVDEDLEAAVVLLDEIMAPTPPAKVGAAMRHPLTEFVEYLHQKGRRLGLGIEVIDRYERKPKGSHRGHIKQTYYGALLFLLQPENRQWAGRLARQRMGEADLLPPDPELQERWIRFLDANASLRNDQLNFRFSTLRTILPESWGGYTQGGGGAIGTLRRVLPLTARFLRDRGYLDAGA